MKFKLWATAWVLALLAVLVALYFHTAWTGVDRPLGQGAYDASVERGEYLARVGNCATCHTTDKGAPFAGGVAFRTPFGTLYSTNITTDSETGIGDWSFEAFYRSMKEGVRPDGTHLYPAFPYTAFAKLTDDDIASLFLYLQTIEPVRESARANALRFPYGLRPLLSVWKALFHDASTYAPDPEKSRAWNRGAYLVEGPGHCGACHSPRNLLGAELYDQALTGGIYFDKVKTGAYRRWSGVNLTPSSTGLGKWSEEDIVAYLKTGQCKHAVVHGPMNKVIMNSTRFLTEEDAFSIATYLKNIPPRSHSADPPPAAEVLKAGEIVYTVHCGSCHLPSGLGDDILGVSLSGSAIVQAPDPASLLNVILYGPHLPPPPFVVDRTRMKMFGKRLSDEDIASVATYVRASFGNTAGAVSPDQVEEQR